MFGLKKKTPPTQPFTHADNCRIVKADPDVQIEWVEVETGHWQAVCQCGVEDYREPPTVGSLRLCVSRPREGYQQDEIDKASQLGRPGLEN